MGNGKLPVVKNCCYTETDIFNIFKCGVYKIFHIHKPDDIYIGSTFINKGHPRKIGFYKRWMCHLSSLRHSKHVSKKVQQHFDMHGIDGIRFSILEICQSKEECIYKELYYFNQLKPTLNTSNDPTTPPTKHVFQFTETGVFVKEYKSIVLAAKALNVDSSCISVSASTGKYKSAGFFWSFSKYINPKILHGK